MKQGETLLLEIRVLDDGALRARRKDRMPLTDEDRKEARRVADSLPGITVEDVLRIFRGAKVEPASQNLDTYLVERVRPDGRREWACSFCGRAVKQ